MFHHAIFAYSIFSLYKEEPDQEMSDEDDLTDNMTDSMMNRTGMKGVKWTKNEDSLLKQMVEQYGEKWDLISSELKERSDIQCQQRWTKVVNPELIKGPWTKEVRLRNSSELSAAQTNYFAINRKTTKS